MSSRKRTRKFILKVESNPAAGVLKKHTVEKGKRFVFIDDANFPEGKMYVIARAVKNIRKPYASATLRSHTVDGAMLFMGNGTDMKGLKVEVQLGDDRYILDSPASVYVPAGTKHTYTILRGSGLYMKVLQAPGGDYNAVTM